MKEKEKMKERKRQQKEIVKREKGKNVRTSKEK